MSAGREASRERERLDPGDDYAEMVDGDGNLVECGHNRPVEIASSGPREKKARAQRPKIARTLNIIHFGAPRIPMRRRMTRRPPIRICRNPRGAQGDDTAAVSVSGTTGIRVGRRRGHHPT
jgi:hypothetical protein